jgi:hypothetical protein
MALSDYVDPLINYLTGTGTNSLLGDITDNAGNIALGGAGLGLLSNAYSRLGAIGDESQAGANIIAQQGLQQAQFRPFTVTSTTGSQFGFTPAAMPSYTTPYAPPSMFPTNGGGGGYVPPSTTFPGTDFVPGESIGPTRLIPAQRSQLPPGVIRDSRFIDNNNNGIDDRDEQPLAPLGSSAELNLEIQEQFIQDMLQGQAESALFTDPYGAAQRQQAAQQAFGLGGQFMGAAAQQPSDLNLLRGQFAGQVGGMLGQQPRPAIGQFGQQALSMGAAGLGGAGVPDVSGAFTGITAPGLRDVSQAYSGIQAPGVRTAAGQLAARGLGLGMAGLETQAPSDVEALRQQYTQLASQTAGRALQDTAGREADVYERIRATQRPEEERQRLALEERLAQQGRLGVRTAMYGGTPEQLAMAKAQEEAQDRASLAAIQQAQAERQQAVSEAQTFGGLFGQQAGLSSQLQSAAQQRAAQLSQLGLSAEQMQAQLEQEGFGRQMQLGQAGMQAQQAQAQLEAQRFGQQLQLGQAGIGAAQAQSALQTQAQQRAAQLSQLGLSAQQIESQLQSEGLGRAATSAQQAAQLAQLAGGLQAQQAGLGAQYAGLGSQLAMQDLAAQQAQQQLALGALAGSYIPQAQLMNVAQLGMTPIEMAQRGQLYGAGLFGEGSMAGLQSRLAAALGQANLFGTVGTGLLSGALGVKI